MKYQNPFEGFASLEEAERLSGKKKQTLRGMARRGELRRYYFGKSLYFAIDELRPRPSPKPVRRA